MDITEFIASKRDSAALLGDYGAYRTQLSRRLATVRKRLGRTSAKGKKYAPPPRLTSDDVGQTPEIVQLQLLVSERAWAHAMHMRSIHSTDTSQGRIQGSDRNHIISRLRKAAANAFILLSVLEAKGASKATDVDILEARAYAESLSGAAAFDKSTWPDSLKHYSVSHIIYTALEKKTKKDVFKEFRTTAIDPSLRYGAHMSRMPRIVTIPTIAKKWFPADDRRLRANIESIDPHCLKEETNPASVDVDGQAPELPKDITWRSRKVALEDVAIATALASANKASSQLSKYLSGEGQSAFRKDKAAAYDDVLIASQDAADAVKQSIDRLIADGVQQGDKRMQALQITRTAVNFGLVNWRVGRNRVLDGELQGDSDPFQKGKLQSHAKPVDVKEPSLGRKLAKLRERVVLYDATLQSLDSVKELPGVAGDSEFVAELDGVYFYFQAFRCLLIARSHAILPSLPNTLALYARAETFCAKSVASSSLQTSNGPADDVMTLEVNPVLRKELHRYLKTEVIRHRALVELEGEKAKASKIRTVPPKPLVEQLDAYPASGLVDLENIVPYPPKLEPVPLKPIFLDVAWNYIEYPGRTKATVGGSGAVPSGRAAEDDAAQPAKKGWFGFGR